MTDYTCDMPKRDLRLCNRRATVYYWLGDSIVATYCAQHDRTTGAPGRMLRPFPWEYDRKETIR